MIENFVEIVVSSSSLLCVCVDLSCNFKMCDGFIDGLSGLIWHVPKCLQTTKKIEQI